VQDDDLGKRGGADGQPIAMLHHLRRKTIKPDGNELPGRLRCAKDSGITDYIGGFY
jgi:5-methyltetrahydrofolate--homocysteine methyltransferase